MTDNDWKNLTPDVASSLVTEAITSTQVYGDIKVIFNRGLLSTQAFSKADKEETQPKSEDLMNGAKGLISEVGNNWRNRLAGQMLINIHNFFKQEGKFYCALYELNDRELIDILLTSKGVEVILSSSDSNEDSRKELHEAMDKGELKVYDRIMKSNSIGHNKFVVFTDKNGNPQSVLTGSTNWTPTGLCGQTNNLLIINNSEVASHYFAYWEELLSDTSTDGKGLQDQPLRTWCRENGADFNVKQNTDIGLWYSPNTQKISKPTVITPDAIPVDMQEVFKLIDNAKNQILYLVFNPGNPSVIDHVKKAAIKAKESGKQLFVRGAVSDAKIAKSVTTNIISKDATLLPDKYKVTGVAAIPGSFSYWEKELLKLGFATIHDKILVVDPFDTENCAVVTGSHNLGLKASYSNDENMILIKGNTSIAKAYTAHVLDIVNHFKWRYKLQQTISDNKGKSVKDSLEMAWHDLNETDQWMDYYYNDNGDLEKEQLLFKV
jgi:phosphatidylserine/phosphatidylglycerophosphate/cardiolipin synthase-like enzyme